MKKILGLALLAIAAGCCILKNDKPAAVAISPDGHNEIRLWTCPLAYEVARDGVVMVAKSEIGIKVGGKCICTYGSEEPKISTAKLSGMTKTSVYKKGKVSLSGNETIVDFGEWAVRLAARDDGVAYRFETKLKGEITIDCEKAEIALPAEIEKCAFHYGKMPGCEETVPQTLKPNEIKTDGVDGRNMVYLPMVCKRGEKCMAITEADVYDYPIWNLKVAEADKETRFASHFSKWPKRVAHSNWGKDDMPSGGRNIKIRESEEYLVKTAGTRNFPWRVFILADRPSKFCEADIVFALAREQAKYDFSWVKPGKVAWDWWNCWDNLGQKQGCTTAGYKRFIDFAAKNGVEYVIFDEGWSETLNIWKLNKAVDTPELIRYGKEKGVGIILWMAWAQVYGDEARVAEYFAKMGAKGFKVDFMDRGDADCERFLWKFADECAKNKMLIDYHGAHRPTGMSRAYPNVLNYEGIHGLEQMKFYHGEDMMDNDVKAFFLRLTAGPMDYTPGAMDNYPLGTYPHIKNDPKRKFSQNPGSLGTRCHQMAMMAVYEAPLQMLSDSPTKYEKNIECFNFMAKTPVVWNNTIGLGGCPDCFAAVARQAKDGSWYAAALNNKDARDFTVDTAKFLGAGEWKAEIFSDAADADTKPTKYVHETGKKIKAGDKLTLHMAKGGGFIVRFSK